MSYAERLQGTPWKEPMEEYVKTHGGDTEALDRALACRGGHIVTVGLGRNGQVGPQVSSDDYV